MLNVLQTLISQYSASPTLRQLVVNIDQYIDPRADLDTFYSFVWNVDTAQGFGLDIWGRIVNVSRSIDVPVGTPNPGFFPWTPGPIDLDDDQYRIVILVKALANITNCTAESLNQILQNLFEDRGRCYVLDTGSMTMEFRFEFFLEPFEYVILTTLGVAPVPAGVSVSIVQVVVDEVFGFDEAVQMQPFDQGVFYNSDPVPVAINVEIVGDLIPGQTVEGEYEYVDSSGLPESGSTYRWLVAPASNGVDYEALSGDTTESLVIPAPEAGNYLRFAVTPSNSMQTGYESVSPWEGPIPLFVFQSTFDGSFTTRAYQNLSRTTLATALGDPVRLALDPNWLDAPNVGFLDGSSGCYFSTPDSTAVSVTGDIDLRAEVYAATGASGSPIGKWSSGQNSFFLYLDATGVLQLFVSSSGSAVTNIYTASVSAAINGIKSIRVTLDVDNGANSVATFYTGDNMAGWVQLGTQRTSTVTSIVDTTSVVSVGALNGGTTERFTGRVFRAQIYNGINGTLVANFDPSTYTSGNTFVAPTTGETWTRNGTSFIAPNGNHFVAPSDAARPQVARVPKGGRRNIALYTEDFTNAAWIKQAGMSVTGNTSIAPDGTTTADTLTFDGTINGIRQEGFSSDGFAYSVYLKQGTCRYAQLFGLGSTGEAVNFDLQDGVFSGVSGGAGSMQSVGNGWYRCTWTSLGAPSSVYINSASGLAQARAVSGPAGTLLAWGAQVESGAASTAYQKVVQAYDATQSGVESVPCLWLGGSQYGSIPGSAASLKFLHDGTGGFALIAAEVFKADDGSFSAFAGSDSINVGATGFILFMRDNGANDAAVEEILDNGGANILNIAGANGSITRYAPQVISTSYLESRSPDEVDVLVDDVSAVAGNTTGAPSSGNSTYDLHLFADGNANYPMTGYLYGWAFTNSPTVASWAQNYFSGAIL